MLSPIEDLGVLWRAAKYSLRFCLKYARRETIARALVSIGTAATTYLGVYALGAVINKVQVVCASNAPVSIGVFSGVLSLFVTTAILTMVVGRVAWFYRNKWQQKLRYANMQDINRFKATLDIACFKSPEFDNLSKQIEELPNGWQARIWFTDEIFSVVATVISFILFGLSLAWYKPSYAIILTVAALPMVISEFRYTSYWWKIYESLVPNAKARSVLERPYKTATAFVQAQMFNQMPELDKAIVSNTDHVFNSHDVLRRKNVRAEIMMHAIANLGLGIVVLLAIISAANKEVTLGTLSIIIAAARTFQSNLESLASLAAEQWSQAKGVNLISEKFFVLKPHVVTTYPVIPPKGIAPTLRFEHVNFTYPNMSYPVLHDVSFAIKPGSKVAIVGKSGNGKSTILSLLMRHYDPTDGAVFADNINLRNIEPNEWNEVASALMQEYAVLERPIAAEIASSRFGLPIDRERVATSADFAHFSEVVAKDAGGYDTHIGVEFGGREFSGGEKQRLALARMYYRGTPVIILDEPDAKLDPESAAEVMDNVFALAGVTVILITHHVSRAERCDDIIVLGKGKIVEQGRHEALLANNGTYASMYAKDRERLGEIQYAPVSESD